MSRMFVSIGILITLFSVSAAGADEIKIATGHTFIKRIFDPIRGPFRDKTGIDITIVFNDPVPALAALEKGNADVAGASLTLESWLEIAAKAGVPVQEIGAYTSYVPIREKSMIVVNAANRVQSLSKDQLKGIFTGRIENWKAVGGDDAPTVVVWPAVPSGAVIVFKATVMDNEPLSKTMYDVESMADTAEAIAATPEAVGLVTGTTAITGLKEIAPAIERPLTLVYRGKPAPPLQKLLDFLKGEGKQYIQ